MAFGPIDVIATVVILASGTLLALGVDGVMKGVFASVAAYYFVRSGRGRGQT